MAEDPEYAEVCHGPDYPKFWVGWIPPLWWVPVYGFLNVFHSSGEKVRYSAREGTRFFPPRHY